MNIRSRLTFLAHLGLILAAVNCNFVEEIPLGIIGPIPIGKFEIDPVNIPERELVNRPEIKVIELENTPKNHQRSESLLDILQEVAHDLASSSLENANSQHEARTLKNENSNFRVSMKSLNGEEPHVSGFMSEVKSTTLPNGQTIVQKFEQPIGDATTDRNLLKNFSMSLMEALDPDSSPVQIIREIPDFISTPKPTFAKRRNIRRRRASSSVKKATRLSSFVDPLEFLIGDAIKRPAFSRARPLIRRRAVKAPKVRFIDPLIKTNLPPGHKRFAPLFGENKRPRSALGFLRRKRLAGIRPLTIRRRFRTPKLVAIPGKDNMFQDFIGQLLGAQSNPVNARDIDEDSNRSSNPIDNIINSLSDSANPISPETNNDAGNDDGILDILAGLAKQSPVENPHKTLQKLLTPTNARKNNRIIVPEQDEEPDFLSFLKSMNNNNAVPSQEESNPLAALLAEPEINADKPNLGDFLNEVLPEPTREPEHIIRLRQRLPKINLQERVPLMNSFYNSRKIRNGGQRLVFPPLGHRRSRIIAIPIPKVVATPQTVAVHHQRTQTHAHHHRRQVTVQKTEPASSGQDLGDLIGQMIFGQGNPDLGRI